MALIPLVLGAVLEGTVEFISAYTWCIGVLWIINGLVFVFTERKVCTGDLGLVNRQAGKI